MSKCNDSGDSIVSSADTGNTVLANASARESQQPSPATEPATFTSSTQPSSPPPPTISSLKPLLAPRSPSKNSDTSEKPSLPEAEGKRNEKTDDNEEHSEGPVKGNVENTPSCAKEAVVKATKEESMAPSPATTSSTLSPITPRSAMMRSGRGSQSAALGEPILSENNMEHEGGTDHVYDEKDVESDLASDMSEHVSEATEVPNTAPAHKGDVDFRPKGTVDEEQTKSEDTPKPASASSPELQEPCAIASPPAVAPTRSSAATETRPYTKSFPDVVLELMLAAICLPFAIMLFGFPFIATYQLLIKHSPTFVRWDAVVWPYIDRYNEWQDPFWFALKDAWYDYFATPVFGFWDRLFDLSKLESPHYQIVWVNLACFLATPWLVHYGYCPVCSTLSPVATWWEALRRHWALFWSVFELADSGDIEDVTIIFTIPEPSQPGVLVREWEAIARIADHLPKLIVILTKPENVKEIEHLMSTYMKLFAADDRIKQKLPESTVFEILEWNSFDDKGILAFVKKQGIKIAIWQDDLQFWPNPEKQKPIHEVVRVLKAKNDGKGVVKTWVDDDVRKYRILGLSQDAPFQWTSGPEFQDLAPVSDPSAYLSLSRDVTVVLPAKVWSSQNDTSLVEVLHKIIPDGDDACKEPSKVILLSLPADSEALESAKISMGWVSEFPTSETDVQIKAWDETSPTSSIFSASPTTTRFDVAMTKKIVPVQGLAKIALPKDFDRLGAETRVVVVAQGWNEWSKEFEILPEVLRRLNVEGMARMERKYAVFKLEGTGLRCIIYESGKAIGYIDVLWPEAAASLLNGEGKSDSGEERPAELANDSDSDSDSEAESSSDNNTDTENDGGSKTPEPQHASCSEPASPTWSQWSDEGRGIWRDLLLFIKNKSATTYVSLPRVLSPFRSPAGSKRSPAPASSEEKVDESSPQVTATAEPALASPDGGESVPPSQTASQSPPHKDKSPDSSEDASTTTATSPSKKAPQVGDLLDTTLAACRPVAALSPLDEASDESEISSTPSSPLLSQAQIDANARAAQIQERIDRPRTPIDIKAVHEGHVRRAAEKKRWIEERDRLAAENAPPEPVLNLGQRLWAWFSRLPALVGNGIEAGIKGGAYVMIWPLVQGVWVFAQIYQTARWAIGMKAEKPAAMRRRSDPDYESPELSPRWRKKASPKSPKGKSQQKEKSGLEDPFGPDAPPAPKIDKPRMKSTKYTAKPPQMGRFSFSRPETVHPPSEPPTPLSPSPMRQELPMWAQSGVRRGSSLSSTVEAAQGETRRRKPEWIDPGVDREGAAAAAAAATGKRRADSPQTAARGGVARRAYTAFLPGLRRRISTFFNLVIHTISNLPRTILSLTLRGARGILSLPGHILTSTLRTLGISQYHIAILRQIGPWLLIAWLTMTCAHNVVAKWILGLGLSWVYAESGLFGESGSDLYYRGN